MFKSNVTETYNFIDATQEIVIMLLGAFLLGCLLTWLLNKLFNKDYSVENSAYRYDHQANDQINNLKQATNSQANTTSNVRIVDKPTNTVKIKNTPDDLTKISGIDTTMQGKLKQIGISSFSDLRDIKTTDLSAFQQQQKIQKREIETWPHQANLAAKGNWKKLKDYQGFIQRVQVASKPKENTQDSDDLTRLVGIDPEIQGILNKNEIHSFKQLSHVDPEILKSHISTANAKFKDTETESWPHQSAMAEKGQWDELKIYQDFMHSDSEPKVSNLKSNSKVLPLNNKTDDKNISNISENNLSDHDDLKKLEGIGPKIEEVLNKGGIYTYSQLYNSNTTRLRQLLDDAGSQFRMHDPESWPHQAGMANRSEWEELKTYQGSIVKQQAIKAKSKAEESKSQISTSKTVTKLKKSSVSNLNDDLRKIEGIGPKIQELLNKAGIHTFTALSKESRDSIKNLLNEAGSQFRMHEPESWPHQAKLAATGKWKELEEYQDFLNGGRE